MYDFSLRGRTARKRTPAPTMIAGAVALAGLLSAGTTPAAVVVFDFDDGEGGFTAVASTVAPGMDAGPWTVASGTLTDVAGSSGRAASAKGWVDVNAFAFELTVAPGLVLALDAFAFSNRASATGPVTWSLLIDGTGAGTGDTSTAGFAAAGGAIALQGLAGTVPILLRASGASSGQGTWSVDEFALHGALAPVPLPPALVLFGAGLAALARRPHRRRAR